MTPPPPPPPPPPQHGTRGRLVHAGSHRVETAHGPFEVRVFQDVGVRRPALAVMRGDVRGTQPLLVRVHSACVTSETLGACDCDCAGQLDAALARIAAEGRGVVFYLMQEGRGAGLVAKARDRMLVQASDGRLDTFEAYAELGLPPDLRRYDVVADLCRLLEIDAPLRLLTNNPAKTGDLERLGLELLGAERIEPRSSRYATDYLVAKRAAGHDLELPGHVHDDGGDPPEPVGVEAPRPLEGAPRILRMGAYWLPVVDPHTPQAAPVWLLLTAYLDAVAGREYFAVSMGDPAAAPGALPLVRVHRERLFERLPLYQRPMRSIWLATLEALIDRGLGCVVFPNGAGANPAADDDRSKDVSAAAIVRDWAGPRAVEPLVADASGAHWLGSLERAGLEVRPPRILGIAAGADERWHVDEAG